MIDHRGQPIAGVVVSDAELEQVSALERALLEPGVRSSSASLERLLHPDFVEIGASGRRWERLDIIDALTADPDLGPLRVEHLQARAVTDDVVVVTYTTSNDARAVERSSWWVRTALGWQVRFHQGTPCDARPDGEAPG